MALTWNWTFLLFIIYLFLQLVHGAPTETIDNPPSKIFKRQLPMISNFDTGPSGTAKVDAVKQGFQDLVVVVNKVLNGDVNTYNTIFLKYFRQEHYDAVKQIFQNMVTPATNDPSTGADLFSQVTVNDEDKTRTCIRRKNVAYTQSHYPVTPGFEPFIHLCNTPVNAYIYPKLGDLSCDKLDNWVSNKMVSLGGYVLLQEVTHLHIVSRVPLLPFKQDDDRTGDWDYGPILTRDLLNKIADKTRPAERDVVSNADSYAWFANEVYWSNVCGRGFGAPQDNKNLPPGDIDCGGDGKCDIQ